MTQVVFLLNSAFDFKQAEAALAMLFLLGWIFQDTAMKSFFVVFAIYLILSCSESSKTSTEHHTAKGAPENSFAFEYAAKMSRNTRSFTLTWSGIPELAWKKIQLCIWRQEKADHCQLIKQADINEGKFTLGLGTDISLSTLLSMVEQPTFIQLLDENGKVVMTDDFPLNQGTVNRSMQYIKASNGSKGDGFGYSAAISKDGRTIATSAPFEDSSRELPEFSNGIQSGAVYVFVDTKEGWQQSAFIKPQYIKSEADFGMTLAMNDDGNLLAIGHPGEDSDTQGVEDNLLDSGAIAIYEKLGGKWRQIANLKSHIAAENQRFGSYSLAMSGNGKMIAVGLAKHRSIYTFVNKGNGWQKDIVIESKLPSSLFHFGQNIRLSEDGSVLAVSAGGLYESGSVYLYRKAKDSNYGLPTVIGLDSSSFERFGFTFALSADGNTLAVGTEKAEDVYIYDYKADNNGMQTWPLRMKLSMASSMIASNLDFGRKLTLSDDGTLLGVLSFKSSTRYHGIARKMPQGEITTAPAISIFKLGDSLESTKNIYYIQPKAVHNASYSAFDQILLSGDGNTLVITAHNENAAIRTINDDQHFSTLTHPDIGAAWFVHF